MRRRNATSRLSIVCEVLTDSDYQAARKYWKVLKGRLKKEGNETVTNCYQLKMLAPDGKMRSTDVADTEQLFRLIQSIPSKKAKPMVDGDQTLPSNILHKHKAKRNDVSNRIRNTGKVLGFCGPCNQAQPTNEARAETKLVWTMPCNRRSSEWRAKFT